MLMKGRNEQIQQKKKTQGNPTSRIRTKRKKKGVCEQVDARGQKNTLLGKNLHRPKSKKSRNTHRETPILTACPKTRRKEGPRDPSGSPRRNTLEAVKVNGGPSAAAGGGKVGWGRFRES